MFICEYSSWTLKIMDIVCSSLGSYSVRALSELSYNEEALLTNKESHSCISFDSAFSLQAM